jgi:signal transduction histidine kinase
MSLQRKFSLLLALLALTVLVNMAVALWTLEFLRAELASPWASVQEVQQGLNHLKRTASDHARNWAGDLPILAAPGGDGAETPDPASLRARFKESGERLRLATEGLDKLESLPMRVGASTTRNIARRVQAMQNAGDTWLQDPQEFTRRAATEQFIQLHELIERVETSVIGGAYSQLARVKPIRSQLLVVVGASLLGVLLAAALGVNLVRRWVVRPVTVLRTAADRLSKGDFGHRVPVLAKDELGLLSAEVNHMAGMISAMQEERVDRERLAAVGEMVRRLAHNLRNPLAGIRSLAELTRADLPSDSPALENQDRIVSTVDRFERWLSELLSATSPLQVFPQPASVLPWLGSVLEPLRPMGVSKGVSVRLHSPNAPERAAYDGRHLEQAVVAVVTNAIQASPRGEMVLVEARRCENGRFWEIRVTDSGPGVPPEFSEKIFRPYFTTKRDGTGIGLAVAKQVVEQHGGRIWAERVCEPDSGAKNGDSAHRGAVFVLRMPLDGGVGGVSECPGPAEPGQDGGSGGQDPHGRRRSESPLLDSADAPAGRA